MKKFFEKTFNFLKKVYLFCLKKVHNVVGSVEDTVEDTKVVIDTVVEEVVETIKTTILGNDYNKFHYEYARIEVSQNEKIHRSPYTIDSS